jgi:hypothetical protein
MNRISFAPRASGRLLGSVLLAAASWAHAGSYTVPRLPDGTPDFRGIWQVHDTAYLNIEGHAGVNGAAASHSIIVDPADGKIPYKPEALAKRDANARASAALDPAAKCYEAGVPRATYLATPLQFVQGSMYTAIVYQDNHAYRIIYPASRPHFDGVDWWMGDSRGHWEGDTLVIDVTTLNDAAWFDAAGNHHSDQMHVFERYTRTGRKTLQYEATMDDPATFTRPWTIRETLYLDTRAGARLLEDECLEDENGVHGHISPENPANLLRNNYRRWDLIQQLPANGAAGSRP